jgi:DNA-binding beta-propeller fold protein YncE
MLRTVAHLLLLVLLDQGPLLAQGEANIWYFGYIAGLDFNSGTPEILSNSQMIAFEGCASMADKNGNLLFYTDGVTVFNQLHQVMVNGNNLNGDYSTTQTLIVQQPRSSHVYYLFTQSAQAADPGFQYSVIDISLQNGLGEVTDKNIPVYSLSTEKICAVNKSSAATWIMTHQWGNNRFAAFLLDTVGLSTTPVMSEAGTTLSGNTASTIGYMKFSPDGSKLAYAIDYDLSRVEVFDFNKYTGVVSNSLVLDSLIPGLGPYGIEFSPNSKILYAANEGLTEPGASHLYQWNLEAGSNENIINSKMEFGMLDNAGALQIAPDGKIYLAQTSTNYLGRINQPDSAGAACEFVQDYLEVGNLVHYGLPGFNQSFFQPVYFIVLGECLGDTTYFSITDLANVDSVCWNFDDPASGADSVSMEWQADHLFTSPGYFEVELIKYVNGVADTFYQTIEIFAAPEVDLGNDTSFCEGTVLELNAYLPGATYLWQDGSTNANFIVMQNGEFSVQVISSAGCIAADTVVISQNEAPEFFLGNDTSLCAGTSLVLDPENIGPIFLWQDGSVNSTLTVSNEGWYWVKITNQEGCSNADSIFVDIFPSPPVPTINYTNGVLISSVFLGNQWFYNGNPIPGANLNFYVPTQSGTYTVMVIDMYGCVAVSDALEVILVGIEEIQATENGLAVFPNPFEGEFTIRFPETLWGSQSEIALLNVHGQTFKKEWVEGMKEVTLSANGLPPGMYFLQVSIRELGFCQSVKLIAE